MFTTTSFVMLNKQAFSLHLSQMRLISHLYKCIGDKCFQRLVYYLGTGNQVIVRPLESSKVGAFTAVSLARLLPRGCVRFVSVHYLILILKLVRVFTFKILLAIIQAVLVDSNVSINLEYILSKCLLLELPFNGWWVHYGPLLAALFNCLLTNWKVVSIEIQYQFIIIIHCLIIILVNV